jgi:hypothetical protein
MISIRARDTRGGDRDRVQANFRRRRVRAMLHHQQRILGWEARCAAIGGGPQRRHDRPLHEQISKPTPEHIAPHCMLNRYLGDCDFDRAHCVPTRRARDCATIVASHPRQSGIQRQHQSGTAHETPCWLPCNDLCRPSYIAGLWGVRLL